MDVILASPAIALTPEGRVPDQDTYPVDIIQFWDYADAVLASTLHRTPPADRPLQKWRSMPLWLLDTDVTG